jgi:hypothetical protein
MAKRTIKPSKQQQAEHPASETPDTPDTPTVIPLPEQPVTAADLLDMPEQPVAAEQPSIPATLAEPETVFVDCATIGEILNGEAADGPCTYCGDPNHWRPDCPKVAAHM